MGHVTYPFTHLPHYVNGSWLEGEKYIDVLNPANGERITGLPLGTAKELEAAVQAARQAQVKWAQFPAPKRAEILYRIGQLMMEEKEDLARWLTIENGKVLEEARGEVQEGIDMAFYMAGEGRRLFGQTTQAELPNKFAMSVRSPIGLVGIITPWNFPLAIATWKAFPALIAGNAVIWKPASETPIMAHKFAKICQAAGLPKGLLNVVYGSGADIGELMVTHPAIQLISFTGSNEIGRRIAASCGRQLKKYSLELGGKNAVIVMEDADLDLAVQAIIWSAFGTSGQRCTACSRVIVHEGIKADLEKALLEEIKDLRIGNGLDEESRMGPIINQAGLEKIKAYIEIGQAEGAKLLCGGTERSPVSLEKGYYFAPSLFTDVSIDMRIAQEEIFGPVLSIIPVASFDEAIAANNSVSFGLSSSIFTQDVNRVFHAQARLDTGIVYINAGTTGAEIHLPFGGTKATGNGYRDSGIQALDVFTEWKAVYVDYSGKLQRAQIDHP